MAWLFGGAARPSLDHGTSGGTNHGGKPWDHWVALRAEVRPCARETQAIVGERLDIGPSWQSSGLGKLGSIGKGLGSHIVSYAEIPGPSFMRSLVAAIFSFRSSQ